MSELKQDDVLFIVKLLQESAFDELHLQTGDLTLHAKKHPGEQALEPEPRSEPDAPAPEVSAKGPARAMRSPLVVPEGLTAIRAPIVGVFYRTPQPGAPPFVDVGTSVSEEDSVCVIEIMKLSRTVSAGIRGRIVQICAEQDEVVEFDQILFLVEPIAEEAQQ